MSRGCRKGGERCISGAFVLPGKDATEGRSNPTRKLSQKLCLLYLEHDKTHQELARVENTPGIHHALQDPHVCDGARRFGEVHHLPFLLPDALHTRSFLSRLSHTDVIT